ncbi:Flavin-linked sulfhydryl oxidase of the mitochondrial IMS [Bonamia ostreae]|uniref:Sulfhydryl oxidase n=1 Tax=Bonamia ostreae TaxID=126728 RepID=A0ABV2AKH8_9EUKA
MLSSKTYKLTIFSLTMKDVSDLIKRDLKALKQKSDENECDNPSCEDSVVAGAIESLQPGDLLKSLEKSNVAKKRRTEAYQNSNGPLNRAEIGRATWAFMHTTAAFYPNKPKKVFQKEMKMLMYLLVKHYPCSYCSDMTMTEMAHNPPRTGSRNDFAKWVCEIHNEVNDRLGKPVFPCDIDSLDKRWRNK